MAKVDIVALLDEIESFGTERNKIIKSIEEAITNAYKKGISKDVNVKTTIDAESGEAKISIIKKVVKEVANESVEITLADALKINPRAVIGDEIELPVDLSSLSRMLIQSISEAAIQKIREAKSVGLYDLYKQKENTILSGQVYGYIGRDIIINIDKIKAILPYEEQVSGEKLRIGEHVKGLLKKVEKTGKEPNLILTRRGPEFISKLFEFEIPEINEGIVKIHKILRRDGVRTKIALYSTNPNVDPVGSCVGLRGSRLKPILDDLRGEKVDLIAYSGDPKRYIADALSPAKVEHVEIIDPEKKMSCAVVKDEFLNLAIGRNSENREMASELVGWKIEIKPLSQKLKEEFINTLYTEFGISNEISNKIYDAGYKSIDKLKKMSNTEAAKFKIPKKILEKIKKYDEETKTI